MTERKIIVWPGLIDHIVIEQTKYTRRKDSQTINGEAWMFYIKKGVKFSFDRPSVKTAFKGQHDGMIDLFSKCERETVDGQTVITAKEIEDKLGKEGLYLGSENAFKPNPGDQGFIFDNMPISDGKQLWVRQRENKPVLRQKDHSLIIQTHIDVCALVQYVPGEGWMPISNCNSLEDALRKEVTDQIGNNLWKPYDVDKAVEDLEEDDKSNESEAPEENGDEEV